MDSLPLYFSSYFICLVSFQSSICQYDISIQKVYGVTVPVLMLRFKFQKARLQSLEEIPTRPFQIQLHIGKSQKIHFLQKSLLLLYLAGVFFSILPVI